MGVTVIGGSGSSSGVQDAVGDVVDLYTNQSYIKIGDKEYLKIGTCIPKAGYDEAVAAGLTVSPLVQSEATQTGQMYPVYLPYDQGFLMFHTTGSTTGYARVYDDYSGATYSTTNNLTSFYPINAASPGGNGDTIVVSNGYSSANNRLKYSTNGGTSWSDGGGSSPVDDKAWRVACNNAGNLWVAYRDTSAAGSICTSTDGISWTTQTPSTIGSTADSIARIEWSEANSAFFMFGAESSTTDYKLYKSTNGYTLTDITPTDMGRVYFIACTDNGDVFVVDANGAVFKTTDAGSTWTDIMSNTPYVKFNDGVQWQSCVVDGNKVALFQYGSSSNWRAGDKIVTTIYTDDGGSTWKNYNPNFLYNEINYYFEYGRAIDVSQTVKGPYLFFAGRYRRNNSYNYACVVSGNIFDPTHIGTSDITIESISTTGTDSSDYYTGFNSKISKHVRIK